MELVVSVRLCLCLFFRALLFDLHKNHYQSKVLVCVSVISADCHADTVNRLLIINYEQSFILYTQNLDQEYLV